MKRKHLKLSGLVLLLILTIIVLRLWTAEAERAAHYTPEYAQVDLETYLEKESLSEEDYEVLYRQTGLARQGVSLLYREGRQNELLYLQERFFKPVEYECLRSNFICRSEKLTGEPQEGQAACNFVPAAQTGDILITFSGHVFGWRSGHAAIVINGKEGLILEATALGSNSEICALEHWREYPGFALLRLKNISEELAEEIASYAVEYLSGVPYDLFSMTYTEEPDGVGGTQCAHLVWAVFKHFGYDLDSDGGGIVTPYDIYRSEALEIVQLSMSFR